MYFSFVILCEDSGMLWFSGEVRDVFYGEFQDSS